MKLKPILIVAFLLIATGVKAQTPDKTTAPIWRPYTVKNEKFSVDLPAFPSLSYQKVDVGYHAGHRIDQLQISFGAYADGVVYTVYVYENVWRQGLDSFIKKQLANRKSWDLNTERKVTLEGVSGKEFGSVPQNQGLVRFFEKGDRLFEFVAYGAPLEDPRMTQFFSSITLTRKKGSLDMSDDSARTFVWQSTPGSDQAPAPPDPNEKIYASSKEVDKKVYLGFKLEPNYTEEARRGQVEGQVILKCVFAADGTITNIRTERGLPKGLTERAIAAARMIKFIPAMKDGKFVSQWMTIEYNFNLY